MYVVKRQFRIWGHEIAQSWSRVNFFGRVIIGAAISLSMAYGSVKYMLKPLNEEITKLREGLVVPENLNPDQDQEIIMHLDRAKNLQSSAASWRQRVALFKERAAHLKPDVHLTVVAEVQRIMGRCGITLISECLYVAPVTQPAQLRSRHREPLPPVNQGPMDKFTHIYETRANFRQIQAFLMLVEELPWRVQLRDLALQPEAGGTATLTFNFSLDIFYLKETK